MMINKWTQINQLSIMCRPSLFWQPLSQRLSSARTGDKSQLNLATRNHLDDGKGPDLGDALQEGGVHLEASVSIQAGQGKSIHHIHLQVIIKVRGFFQLFRS